MRVAYLLKQYPRFSETFVVNEILAHEAAGLELAIYSLRSAEDGRFQDGLARVRAAVQYVPMEGKLSDFWEACEQAAAGLPSFPSCLSYARGAPPRDVYQALVMASDARRRGIEHLHAHFASVATTVARLAAHFAELPYTFTAHAKDIYHESVADDDLRPKLRDAAGVVTVSDFNVRHLRSTYGADAAGVRRIYNGLDLSKFSYSDPRERPGRIVAVGRLVEKKGFFDLLEACAILARGGRAFRCEIIGSGDLEEPLRRRIEELGLGVFVAMLGPLPQLEVAARVRQAAVLAAPCIVGADGNRDGLPTVLLEAMALGTPCVATDVTGIPELVEHERTGLLVPQRDPERLASALGRLLGDASLRARLARSARQRIEADFDIEQNAARLRRLFSAARLPRRAAVVEEALSCA